MKKFVNVNIFECIGIEEVFVFNLSTVNLVVKYKMQNQIVRIRNSFLSSLESIDELLNFDRMILDFSIKGMERLTDTLKNQFGVTNPNYLADGHLRSLKNIRENDSMRIQYKRVFNQFLVLLVSHFASTIRDLFETSIDEAVESNKFEKIIRTKVEVTLGDLKISNENRSSGEILAIQKDISFQDMQSIGRAFQEYFDFTIQKDKAVHNIIIAQACRHAIVHSGAKVDKKLLHQVSNAVLRTVKPTLDLNSEILFSPDEIKDIGKSMREYLEVVFGKLEVAFGVAQSDLHTNPSS